MRNNYDLLYFMGDSFTHGNDEGTNLINENNRFSGLISKHYNIPNVNNAVPGCSNMTIMQQTFTDILEFLNKGKKVLAIICDTQYDRLELYCQKNKRPMTISPNFSFFKDYMLECYSQDYNKKLTKNLYIAMESFFYKNKVDYIMSSISEYDSYFTSDNWFKTNLCTVAQEDGRFYGNMHFNVLGHQRVANELIKKINELY